MLQMPALLLFQLLLRALQQHEVVVAHKKPSDRFVDGAGLCEQWVLWVSVSWAESSYATESRREHPNHQLIKVEHSPSANPRAPFSTGQHMGRTT